jgi:hypothetical protein
VRRGVPTSRDPLDSDLDHEPPRIDPRGPLALHIYATVMKPPLASANPAGCGTMTHLHGGEGELVWLTKICQRLLNKPKR